MKLKSTNSNKGRFRPGLISAASGLIFLMLAVSAGDRTLYAVTAQQLQVTLVNAASYANDTGAGVTSDSIGALFGQFVTQGNQVYAAAPNQPLPTKLGGVSVTIGGKPAALFFVAASQINLAVPSGLPEGINNIVVTNVDNSTRTGTVKIVTSEPGIFSAKSDGKGNAAALTTKDGVSFATVFNPDGSEKPTDAGTRQQPNYLVLFGTGIRTTPATNPTDANGVAEAIIVTIQGVIVPVLYAGPAPGFVGLDQINVTLPPELSGFGTVNVNLSTPSRGANTVTIRIGGELPPVRLSAITFGNAVNGELTLDDQVQIQPSNGKTFFFDGYVFNTTAANTSVAIDMRSTRFDTQVGLFRIVNGGLEQIGQDDQSGGNGAPATDKNNNALLLSVIVTPGQYAIFATSSDEQANGTGTYTLRISNNVIQQTSYGANISGQITTADYRNSANTYLDCYWFNAISGDNVRINLNSAAFDPFLLLYDNTGDLPIFNDNISDTNKNSQIDFRLPKSLIYIVVVTPFQADLTGSYTLTLNRAAAGMALDGELPLGLESMSIGRNLLLPKRRSGGLTRQAPARQVLIEE